MTSYTRCATGISRNPIHRTQWQRICLRQLSSATTAGTESIWIEPLRAEMLRRKLPALYDYVSASHEDKALGTLSSFLPPGALSSPSMLGHHLFYFNPTVETADLLPDGMDKLHSPGASFPRRMWAGGGIRLNPEKYWGKSTGWIPGKYYTCFERIKDVQVRGSGDAVKVFVAIERRIARKGAILGDNHWESTIETGVLREQAENEEEWGDAMLIEDRNLVFMRAVEKIDVGANTEVQMAPIKYLKPPGEPDFSHTLTPTPSLLFRFSSLTFNAHAIHLDQQYAREIEGHHSTLVHGPLSLVLLLSVVHSHLKTLPKNPQIQSIQYRNLAPLYCNEPMRLCGRQKSRSEADGTADYDVWIEGPTGGMAVKGTLRTQIQPEDYIDSPKLTRTVNLLNLRHLRDSRTWFSKPPGQSRSYSSNARQNPPNTTTIVENTTSNNAQDQALSRKEKRRLRALTLGIPPVRRVKGPGSMKRVLSPRQEELATREPYRYRRVSKAPKLKYISPIRYHYRKDSTEEERTAAKVAKGRFAERGVRKVTGVRARPVLTPSLKEAQIHKRIGDRFGGYREGGDGRS